MPDVPAYINQWWSFTLFLQLSFQSCHYIQKPSENLSQLTGHIIPQKQGDFSKSLMAEQGKANSLPSISN